MNRRVSAITPSVTLGITSKAKAMAAAGESVCSFAAGEPDFDTPEHIKAAAIRALESGETKYAPVAGISPLREAVSTKLREENGLDYEPSQIVVSCGAKHSLFNAIMTICDEGDEVIIPAPFWLSYEEMVGMAGAACVIVPGSEDNDYKLTPEALEAAITDKTRALVLNTPSNPIGIVYTGEELRALAEIAAGHGILIIADEIYEKLIYDGMRHVSVGSFSEEILAHTITINGFSKCASMTGWRLGYAAAPAAVAKGMSALQSHSTSGATTFAQYGALEALTNGIDGLDQMVAAFAKRRDTLYSRLTAMDGIRCVRPHGAFYILPCIDAFGMDSVTFAEKLLEAEKVAVVPGKPFGADGNVRLSYACSMENIQEGMDRLERFLEGL